MTSRILITGSRDWTSREVIEQALYMAYTHLELPITLVSGACPTGADRLAEEIWEAKAWMPIELHPADWNTYGKSAGFRRNAEMVQLGADVCLAFIKNNSRGATHTAKLAERAGIKTLYWRE